MVFCLYNIRIKNDLIKSSTINSNFQLINENDNNEYIKFLSQCISSIYFKILFV